MQSSAHMTVTSLPRSLRPFRSSILINPHSLLLEPGGLARRLGPSRDMAVEMRSYRQGPHVTGRHFVGRYAVAALKSRYLFNPYTVATCLAKSTTTLDNTLLLLAISCAAKGTPGPLVNANQIAQTIRSSLCLSLASHTSLYPILLLPTMMMRYDSRSRVCLYTFCISGILSLSNSYMFGHAWITRTWGIM